MGVKILGDLDVTGSFEATSFITSTGSYIRSQYNTSHWSQLESNASGGVIKAVDGGVTTILLRSYGDSYFTGGGLGVGTTSPSAKLHVKSNSNAATGIHVENSLDNNGTNDSDAAAQISFEAASNNGYLRVHGSPTDVASEHQIDLGSTAGGSFITFSPTNSEKVRIAANGYVGIGTTSPNYKLDVEGDIQINETLIAKSGVDLVLQARSGQAVGINSNGARTMTIDASNNVGIGTTTPSSKLHINGDVKVGTNISVNNTFGNKASNKGINFESPSTGLQTARVDSDAFRFYFGGSGGGGEVLRILEGGNVGIGTTSPSEKLEVNGNILASGDITAFSDERLKEDIKPLQDSLEKVQAIQGVSFVKKNDEDKKQKIGFIAQQLKEVLPEVVNENEDGIHSVAYGNITALLVEAVKEQQDIISQLEERIVKLENK